MSTDGGKEELMPQGDQRKVQEDTGNSDIILTWGSLVGYVLAVVLVALTFRLQLGHGYTVEEQEE